MNQPITKEELLKQIENGTATADTYYLLGLKTEEEKYFRQAITLDPRHAGAYLELARSEITERPAPKNPQQALQDISKAVELSPNVWEAYQLRALLYYYTLKQPEKALADLKVLLKQHPNNEDALELKRTIEEEKISPPATAHTRLSSSVRRISRWIAIIAALFVLLCMWSLK